MIDLEYSTWEKAENIFKTSLRSGDCESGLDLLKSFEPHSWKWVHQTEYSLYAVALLSSTGQIDEALKKLKEAYEYGYQQFWHFNPHSHGWGQISDDDPHGIFEDYRFLKDFYEVPGAVEYVKECQKRQGWKSIDPTKTPLCWVEETTLTRKNIKCELSNKKLEKGGAVYLVRYFNGARDIPSDPFYVSLEDGQSNPGFMSNIKKYKENNYQLEDFNFHVGYSHPLINKFWNRLDRFDLDEALQMIANPVVSPTPYVLTDPEGNESYGETYKILSGTGGEFLDLLWVLIKTGHLPKIIERLPSLPAHFKVTLMLFEDTFPTEKEILGLVQYGQKNPELQKLLAESLNLYEFHLYSNYHPHPNWYFYEFRHFKLAGGGRFLYILASNYELINSLKMMKDKSSLPSGLGQGGWDSYNNSRNFLIQALIIGLKLQGHKDFDLWAHLANKQTTKILKS